MSESPPQDDIVFQNKILAANVVAGSSYVVAVVGAIPIAHKNDDSSFADYNFLNKSELHALDAALQAFMQGNAHADFSITEMGDGDAIIAAEFNSIESLAQPVKHEAIRLAHDILNKLKIKFGDESLGSVMKSGDNPTIKALLSGVDKVAITFNDHLERAGKIAPELLEDDEMIEASNALGAFKHQGKRQMIKDLESELASAKAAGNSQLVSELTQAINKLKVEVATAPEEHKVGSNKPIKELIEAIEVGMDKLAQKMQEMTQAGLNSAATGRDLGGAGGQEQQGNKPSTMDLGKPQNDAVKQNQVAAQQNNIMQEVAQTERATSKENTTQTQQADAQKAKESQEARQQRQEARQQRAERQHRQENRQQQAQTQQTQQAQEQQARQQRQEARQQQQARQQRQEARQVRQEQAQNTVNNNTSSIADNLRQMRRNQREGGQREGGQKEATQATSTAPQPQEQQPQIATKPAPPAKAPTLNQTPSTAATQNNDMQSMLASSGMAGLQNMQKMQDMEVPDALKPNSPARMIKAITQQRAAEQTAIQATDAPTTPAVPTSDLPILIKQNNQPSR